MAATRVTITMPEVIAEKLKAISEEYGESISGYASKAIIDRMAADTAPVLAEYGARREAEEREDEHLGA